MSNVDGLQTGWARLLSRVAALFILPLALSALRIGAGWYAFLAIATSLAYESNRHRVPSIVRLLAIVMQALGLLAFAALVVMMAMYAEAGHRGYEYISVLLWLVLAAVLFVGVVATVAAARTLRLGLIPRP